jgi:hypothetical protein
MKKLISFLVVLSLILLVSCEKGESYNEHVFKDVTIIGTTSVSAIVKVDLNPTISKIHSKGVCWDVETDPTIFSNMVLDAENSSSYTVTMNGLEFNQIYYIRAYVITDFDTIYSDLLTFYR